MTTSPFMIFLNNWELILKYQHFLLDPYSFQGMIREPTQAVVHAHMWSMYISVRIIQDVAKGVLHIYLYCAL